MIAPALFARACAILAASLPTALRHDPARFACALLAARATGAVVDGNPGYEVQLPDGEFRSGMSGDDRARFCGQCGKHVYNLSGMSREQVEAVLGHGELPAR